jgi:SAM-dependent methyltransferase
VRRKEIAMATQVDYDATKLLQQQVWSAGDFALVATATTNVGEELCEAVDVLRRNGYWTWPAGGNGALAAARTAWENTVGVDYVPELLEHGRRRAATERLEVEFVEGDAEDLPSRKPPSTVVISIVGSVHAPNQEQVPDRMLRGRSGGPPENELSAIVNVTTGRTTTPEEQA